jgi:hypothetical protein
MRTLIEKRVVEREIFNSISSKKNSAAIEWLFCPVDLSFLVRRGQHNALGASTTNGLIECCHIFN